jgi:glycine/D-amino acid oxidase-like deaminating enzyme/GNAT superfamily N-acetyltransferase
VRSEEGERWLGLTHEILRSEGVEVRTLNASEVQGLLHGGDFDDVRLGLYTPKDAIFWSVELSMAYAHLASRNGAEFRWGRGALSVHRANGVWEVQDGTTTHTTSNLILACGAWTKKLLAELGHPLPLAPFRTQAGVLRPFPLVDAFPTLHDTDLNIYVRPAMQGRILVGNGTWPDEVDPNRDSPRADPDFLDRMTSQVRSLFPEWSTLHAEAAWAGVSVASQDAFPLVGKVPRADGLFVATGFNGFGAMRAGSLARHLADGIIDDRWESLFPADPARFPNGAMSFPPRPEFSIRDDGSSSPSGKTDRSLPATPPLPLDSPATRYRTLQSLYEVDKLDLPPLSDWFDAFLPLFTKDAIRCRGEVQIAEGEEQGVSGVYLGNPAERTVSIFTHTRCVAEHFLSLPGRGEIYTEHDWAPGADVINIMLADLRDWNPDRPLRNPVRVADARDLPQVLALIREVHGPVDLAWFETLPRPEEICFVSEVNGRIVGASWLTVVGANGRGHSLAVHPRYRRLGIGTDMLVARMLWLKGRGVPQVISEIYEDNLSAMTAAERAGMTKVGRMFVYHRT